MSAATRLPAAVALAATLLLAACTKPHTWQYVPTPPPPPPSQNFDVQYTTTDPNGAPRNIDWHQQLSGQIPNPDACEKDQPYKCTGDTVVKDQPSGLYEFACFFGKATAPPFESFFGHADWMVAQYNGSISWLNYNTDDDYNLVMIPANDNLPPLTSSPPPAYNGHGLTTNNNYVDSDTKNPQYMELEFDSVETDPAFKTTWWSKFVTAGEKDNNYDEVQALLHPNKQTLACGTALGLFGLDCDHGCRSELHPVYGLAVQTTDDPNDNEWSVMARNWGTGGFCSQFNDELAETSLSLLLPYKSDKPPVKVEVPEYYASPDGSSASIGCPKVYFNNGQTIVTITLPPPDQRPVAAFTLKIQWPDGASPAACTQPYTSPTLLAHTAAAEPVNEHQSEDYLRDLLHASRPDLQRPTIKDIAPPPAPAANLMARTAQPQNCQGPITVISGAPPAPTVTPTHPLAVDLVKRSRDEKVREAICHASRTSSFTLPTGVTQAEITKACKGVM